jgi:hypothetical protein
MNAILDAMRAGGGGDEEGSVVKAHMMILPGAPAHPLARQDTGGRVINEELGGQLGRRPLLFGELLFGPDAEDVPGV